MESLQSSITVSHPSHTDVVFSRLKEGEEEPVHGKKINHIIAKSTGYIVYLDDHLTVYWATGADYPKDWIAREGCAEIINEIAYLESLSAAHTNKQQKTGFRRMLGEAVARVLDTQSPEQARYILDRAMKYIEARCAERARIWYLAASLGAVASAALFAITLWIFRDSIVLGSSARSAVLCACGGALGAFFSILLRAPNVLVDPSSSRKLYVFEGVAKIMIGMIGAIVMYLGIKTQLIFGSIVQPQDLLQDPFNATLLLCVIAGASERLIPGIIKKIEMNDEPGAKEDGASPQPAAILLTEPLPGSERTVPTNA